MTVTWMDAKGADGNKVVEWLETRVDVQGAGDVTRRRVLEWRKPGAIAQFDAVDRAVTRLGRHISELPDDVWLDYGARDSAAPTTTTTVSDIRREVESRYCLSCGGEISRVTPSGRRLPPNTYAKRTYCSQPCQWEGHSVTGQSREFARNAFRGKAA